MQPLETRGAEIERAVLGYAAAWNEDDDAKLRAILAGCWAESGTINSNFERHFGRAAVFERISCWRRANRGCRALLTSGIEHHHDLFRFTAVIIRPDGTEFSPALEIDDEGRIARIITFHLDLPAPPARWPNELVRRF
jgi:hypothetical protein